MKSDHAEAAKSWEDWGARQLAWAPEFRALGNERDAAFSERAARIFFYIARRLRRPVQG